MRPNFPILLVTAALLAASSATPRAQPAAPRWYKGNTHTHTLNSDGDSTPDEVVRWYREHRYDFLVLTDHNFLTAVEGLNALHGADERFLVIKGEEVTDRLGDKPLHINGLDVGSRVAPQGGTSVPEILQRNVDAIRQAKGVPHINHPNFRWAITPAELQQVRNNKLLEIYNGHPQVNNIGGGGVPGMEEVWDAVLSSGVLVYGIAVDDAHTFKDPGNADVAGPGRGWVSVRAARLEARALLEAMERGDFYASNGVELVDYRASTGEVAVTVKPTPFSKYKIQFIGKGGRVLSEIAQPTATYQVKGDEGYVRARVIESNGRMAWGQPVVVTPRNARYRSTALLLVALATIAGLLQRSSSAPKPRSA